MVRGRAFGLVVSVLSKKRTHVGLVGAVVSWLMMLSVAEDEVLVAVAEAALFVMWFERVSLLAIGVVEVLKRPDEERRAMRVYAVPAGCGGRV